MQSGSFQRDFYLSEFLNVCSSGKKKKKYRIIWKNLSLNFCLTLKQRELPSCSFWRNPLVFHLSDHSKCNHISTTGCFVSQQQRRSFSTKQFIIICFCNCLEPNTFHFVQWTLYIHAGEATMSTVGWVMKQNSCLLPWEERAMYSEVPSD